VQYAQSEAVNDKADPQILLVQIISCILARLPALSQTTNSRQARQESVFHLRKPYLNFSFVCATWSLALKKVLGANTLLPACSSLVPPLAGAQVGLWAVVMAYCTGLRLLVRYKLCQLACSCRVLLWRAGSKKAETQKTLHVCLRSETGEQQRARAMQKARYLCL